MHDIIIKEATFLDLKDILDLYLKGKEIMRSINNFNQWNESYPSKDIALKDIENKWLHLIYYKSDLVGIFSIIDEVDESFLLVKDKIYPSKYVVIHRIVSSLKIKGIFKIVLDYSLSKYDHILIDTHKDNLIMLNLFRKYNFKFLGDIISDNIPRKAYEYLKK